MVESSFLLQHMFPLVIVLGVLLFEVQAENVTECKKQVADGLWEKCQSGHLQDSLLGVSEVTWLGPESNGVYMGSPSITETPEGNLLVTHDYFGRSTLGYTTRVYQSCDQGKTWNLHSELRPMYWGVIFLHGKQLFMLGVDSDNKPPGGPPNVVISASTDAGATWSSPSVLFQGSVQYPYHCAPTPVVQLNGRLYRAMETFAGPNYSALVIHASVGSDLLQPSSWARSNVLPFQHDWMPSSWGTSGFGWQEGSAVPSSSGQLWNMLRLDGQRSNASANKALLTKLDASSGNLSFVRLVDMPAGSSKFTVRQDPVSKAYLTLSSSLTPKHMAKGLWRARNNLVLVTSEDLVTWHTCKTLLVDDSGFDDVDSSRFTGFQYVDWIFSGKDIKYAVRASYRGANTFHNSNRILFKTVKDYAGKCLLQGISSTLVV